MILHSIVDIITNSSQEIFILPTDSSEEVVQELLERIWEDISGDPFPFRVTKAAIGYRGMHRWDKNHPYVKYNDEHPESKFSGFDGEWHPFIAYNIGDVVVTAGYYWGFGGPKGDKSSWEEEYREQENFEAKLTEYFPGWTSYQMG